MRVRYKLIKVLFNTGMEKEFVNADITPDTRGYHIRVDSDYLFIPFYNVLYVSMEGKID